MQAGPQSARRRRSYSDRFEYRRTGRYKGLSPSHMLHALAALAYLSCAAGIATSAAIVWIGLKINAHAATAGATTAAAVTAATIGAITAEALIQEAVITAAARTA